MTPRPVSDLDTFRPSAGQCAALASLLEATAPKPGNVHRGADFDDLTYPELVAAGIAIMPAMDHAVDRPLGETILAAVSATRHIVRTNANLGIILLLAPLAAVPKDRPVGEGVREVLGRLRTDDAENVYRAIQLAAPGGLGKVAKADVSGPPPEDLISAMRLAADRDLVARQYTTDFHDVLAVVVPYLRAELEHDWPLADAIVRVHLQLMSQFPDSLIARKCGAETAQRAADQAAHVLASGKPGDESYLRALSDFDFWLRSDGHRRNPGTTADLVAAGLFVGLRDGIITKRHIASMSVVLP